MSRRRILIIAMVVASIAIVTFLQVEAARNLNVEMHDSKIVERNGSKTTYDLTLRLENPSILLLSIGDTSYSITVNGEKVGDGKIDVFMLGPFESKTINSKFVADTSLVEKYKNSAEQNHSRLSGASAYRLYLLTLDVPFDHEPTPEQIRQFFNQ